MFQVIKTGWPQHGQATNSSNALLFVSWISRAMDWGQHNWVWDKAPVSWLKLSKFHQDLNPHLIFIFRPGHGILSRYWNSYFTVTMVRHPHHDNKVSGIGTKDPGPLLSQWNDTLSSSHSKLSFKYYSLVVWQYEMYGRLTEWQSD